MPSRLALGVSLAVLLDISCACNCFAATTSDAKLLFLGNKNIAPVVYLDGTVPSGVAVDIVRALAEHLSQPVEIGVMDWVEAQALVARGDADALIQINETEERRKLYDFSDTLLESRFSIFTSTERVGISGIASLRGLRVGVESAGLPQQLLAKDHLVQLTVIPNFLAGFHLLNEGSIDAVVVDYRVGSYVLAENGLRNIKVTGEPVTFSYSAIAVRKGNVELLGEINNALRTIKNDGTYQAVLEKWKPKEAVFQTREQITREVFFAIILGLLVLLLVSATWMVMLRRELSKRRVADQKLRAVVESIPDLVWLKDLDGAYISCNPQFERLFGATEAEIVGKTDYDFVDRELADFFRDHDRKAMASGKSCTNEEWLTFAENGYCGLFETIKTPMFDQAHQPVGVLGIARDVTDRNKAAEQLRIAAAAFEAQEGIVITDAKQIVLRVNRAFSDITGYGLEDVVGKTPRLLQSGRHDAVFYLEMWQRIGREGSWQGEIWNRRKNGEVYPEWLNITTVKNDQGEVSHYVGTMTDITARKVEAQKMEHLAYYDPLTHLPNRRLLDDRLSQSIAQSQRAGTRVAVCYLDLDGFKDVNDRFSHEAGDQLLVEAAGRLTACVRAGDTVARIGGDEFVVLLSNLADDEECQVALDRLLQAMSAPYAVGDTVQTGISASVGVTLFPSDPVDADTLVRHADHAMYAAKQAGKNRYQWFDTQFEQRIEARLSTLSSLAEALKLGQFRLCYQPKVNCRQGRVVGAEALIRWQHPTLGLLSPAEFLPLIEDSDLALSFGDWVLREALSQMVVWRREGIELRVSVNAFASQLISPGLVDGLAAILEEYNEAGPGCLQIEIVETAALRGMEAIRQAIKDCGELGVTFSLDDFGTGYSTLAHLRHLPATEIKIDQSFVLHMLDRAEDLAMVESVIGLGRAFGRSIVAEGVETAHHIVRLLALGCDVMQGYALARPMAAADIPRWLSEFRPDPAWAAAEMPKQSAPTGEIL